jgi:FAD/FMN-containing dehydrogenase
MDHEALTRLLGRLRGSAIAPGDADYDEARMVWNGVIDKKPALIVLCQGVADVIDAVNYARKQGLKVSVRGGGHHVAGSSVIDNGLVIDLSSMRSVRVDPSTATVRAEGGALLHDMDRETQAFGLAVPLGVVSETGIAGLTLAGGLGWLRRKHGLSCDNLLSADVVTADGRLVHATPNENAELLWALRGGGWDLGVVTSLEYRAHPLGPNVWVSLLGFPWSEAKRVIQRFREFAETAPEGFGALCVCWTVPELEDFPLEAWGEPFVVIVGPYAGSVAEAERVTQPLRSLGTVLGDLSGPMPYVEAQSALFDEDYPRGLRYYWRSTYLRDLPDAAIETLMDLTLRRPSPETSLDIWTLGGEIDRHGPADSAAGQRGAPWLIGIESNWKDPAADAANIAWAREAGERLAPFSTGGSYMNFEDPDDAGATASAYGENLARLVEIKKQYDPGDLFKSRRGLIG